MKTLRKKLKSNCPRCIYLPFKTERIFTGRWYYKEGRIFFETQSLSPLNTMWLPDHLLEEVHTCD